MRDITDVEKELLKKLGQRIKELRIKKGYTNYEHFAYEHGISRTQYGKYETGENVKFLTLVKILKGLDTSLEDFFSEGF
ncbi:MAG: helix-turn-helix domain-containing protein [Hymenobacteraceae bacterium]|nr:helix-turn-helix domain-containing protein [Hymenobacteraceae bacterium]MDX5512957.1 helix-turn-helix domain-containing protein [Hymenobacteraceae bacterium]